MSDDEEQLYDQVQALSRDLREQARMLEHLRDLVIMLTGDLDVLTGRLNDLGPTQR